MKKVVCIILALVLSFAAFAETAPSKTVKDMAIFTPEAEGLIIEEIETDEADAEIEVLAKAETLEAYFGEETIAAVEEITENEFPCVCEFMSIRVEGYEEEMGDVKTNGKFASTFEQDAKVATLIGFTTEEGIEWNVFEAIGLEDGTIDMIIPGELLERVQDEGAFFSVIK